MYSLQIEFRIGSDRIYSMPPLTVRGAVSTTGVFSLAPGTMSDQCPGCGRDINDVWSLEAEAPGKAPEEGDAFASNCRECGFRHFGSIVVIGA